MMWSDWKNSGGLKMTAHIRECYRKLGLNEGASANEVKQAWRDHVKAWHPDGHPNDPGFQKRATEKTKEINGAKEIILAHLAGGPAESETDGRAEPASSTGARYDKSERTSSQKSAGAPSESNGDDGKPKVIWICNECGTKFGAPYDAYGMHAHCPHCHHTVKLTRIFKEEPEPGDTYSEFLPGAQHPDKEKKKQSIWTREFGTRRKRDPNITWAQENLTWEQFGLGLVAVGIIVIVFLVRNCHGR
jgi:hypothetical protein